MYLSFSIVLENDSHAIVQRVAIRNEDIPLGEQTMAKVIYSISSSVADLHMHISYSSTLLFKYFYVYFQRLFVSMAYGVFHRKESFIFGKN